MQTKTFCHGLLILALSFLLSGCMVNVGVVVTGLTGTGLVLQNNGSDDLIIDADGSYTFKSQANTGGTYAVTVKTQPGGQVCTVSNGSGSVTASGVNVSVECAPDALQVLAGSLGGLGNVDGTGAASRFNSPWGIAVDGAGTAYVADTNNHTIRKISPAGVVTTFAGTAGRSGSADGTGSAALFDHPYGIAVDSAGNVYVADTNNHSIRRISPAGVVTTLAGSAGSFGSADGSGAAALFNHPSGIAVDSVGNAYVADMDNSTIRKVSPGGLVTTVAGIAGTPGSDDGAGSTATFNHPFGIAVDSAGNVYVADTYNNTIRRIDAAGVVSTIAGSAAGSRGFRDGIGADASFSSPRGIAVDGTGVLYVTDTNNNTIRSISPAGAVTTIAGTAYPFGYGISIDATGAAAAFATPTGIALDPAGTAYVTDTDGNTIRRISPAGVVTTWAGTATNCRPLTYYCLGSPADGSGATARFFYPQGIASDSLGNIYVADTYTLTIRKISPAGLVSTLAGLSYVGGNRDGTGSAAEFNLPAGIAVDSAGQVYVADTGNSTIRKITSAGVVTTLAGGFGSPGSADGKGTAAGFSHPAAVAVDAAGNVYVADTGNHTIRKISPAGVVTTIAGSPSSMGNADGAGAAARFYRPAGIAVDGAGNVYVADSGNNRIRKISPAGMVTTIAGTFFAGSADGPGATATFDNPSGIAVDGDGNAYVADANNNTIRKISPAGVVTTVVGVAGRRGVQLGPLPATLGYGTVGVAVSAHRLFVTSENSVLWAPKL